MFTGIVTIIVDGGDDELSLLRSTVMAVAMSCCSLSWLSCHRSWFDFDGGDDDDDDVDD